MHPQPPTPTLSPYTTLFRSKAESDGRRHIGRSRERMSLSPTLEPSLLSPTDLLEQIELLQKQLTDLHNEVNFLRRRDETLDRKSTRLNSSHITISYAVFCLK